jgi:hypothetical protein
MTDPPESGSALAEMLASIGAALLAGYVRGRHNPRPLSFPSFFARTCEAIVCGCIASGLSVVIDIADARVTVALSAALGLVGASLIGDILADWIKRRAAR